MAQVTTKENEVAETMIKLAQGIPLEITVTNCPITEGLLPKCLQKLDIKNKENIIKILSFFSCIDKISYVKRFLNEAEKKADAEYIFKSKFTRQNLLDFLPEIRTKFKRDEIDGPLIEQIKLIFFINRHAYSLINTVHFLNTEKLIDINKIHFVDNEGSKKRKLN